MTFFLPSHGPRSQALVCTAFSPEMTEHSFPPSSGAGFEQFLSLCVVVDSPHGWQVSPQGPHNDHPPLTEGKIDRHLVNLNRIKILCTKIINYLDIVSLLLHYCTAPIPCLSPGSRARLLPVVRGRSSLGHELESQSRFRHRRRLANYAKGSSSH